MNSKVFNKDALRHLKSKRRMNEDKDSGEGDALRWRSNVIEFPNGDYFYVEMNDNKLVAGHATNMGIIPEFSIEFDNDMSLDDNLSNLYDHIIELNPELLDEGLKEVAHDYDPYVIYRENGVYKGTPKSNFDAHIENARKVTDLSDFDSVKEIKDYFYKYGWIKNEDEIIVDKSAMSTMKESKVLHEGPGAGYDVKSEGYNLSGELVDYTIKDDGRTKTYDCVVKMNGNVNKFSANSYYFATGDIYDLPIECDGVKFELPSDVDVSGDDVKNIIIDSLKASSNSYIYGGGWSHSTFDGTLSDVSDEYPLDGNPYYYFNDLGYDESVDIWADIRLSNPEDIDRIDEMVRGDNVDYFYDILKDDDIIHTLTDEEEAIEYAKKHDADNVDKYGMILDFEGEVLDTFYDDTVWENDNINESAKKLNEDSSKANVDEDLLDYLFNQVKFSKGRHIEPLLDRLDEYDDVISYYDDDITKDAYDATRDYLTKILYNADYYSDDGDLYIQLSDNHTMWDITSPVPEQVYVNVVDLAADDFKFETGEEVYLLGRSGRHVCVELTLENLENYNKLLGIQNRLEQELIKYLNKEYEAEDK